MFIVPRVSSTLLLYFDRRNIQYYKAGYQALTLCLVYCGGHGGNAINGSTSITLLGFGRPLYNNIELDIEILNTILVDSI